MLAGLAQANDYTTPDPPSNDDATVLTPGEELLNRAGVEGVEAKLAEIAEGCNFTLYNHLLQDNIETSVHARDCISICIH